MTGRLRKEWTWIPGLAVFAVVVGAGWAVAQKQPAAHQPSSVAWKAPAEANPDQYVGREMCAGCHLDQDRQFAKTVEVSPSPEAIDPGPATKGHFATSCAEDPGLLSPKDKLDLCRDLHSRASQLDPRIVNVHVRYMETQEWKAFANRAKQLTQNVVRKVGLDSGLVDFKVCSIDDTWSGLKFTRRASSRTGSH